MIATPAIHNNHCMLVRVLKDLLRRPNADRRTDRTFPSLLQDAVRLWSDGDLVAAEASCRQALAIEAASVDALHLLGTLLHAAHRSTEAIVVLERARTLAPDDAEVRLHLANALATNAKLDDASAEFRESVRLRPGFAPAL